MRTSVALALALLAGCPGLIASDSATEGAGATTTTTGGTPTTTLPDLTTTGFMLACHPGAVRCSPDAPGVLETCKDTGLEWEASACSDNEDCVEDLEQGGAFCIGPCEMITNPTSVGCEFLAIRMNSFNFDPGDTDALIVGNTDRTRTASVQLYFTPNNSLTEAPLMDPVLLAPGESHVFDLASDTMAGYTSFRTGGVYRVVSDIPVTAYLHSALVNEASNDASMLLPTPTLRRDHVIASYPGFADKDDPVNGPNGRPSYFNVIALANDTTVEWVAPRDTAAAQGAPIPVVPAGETGSFKLNRFDVLQVGASSITDMEWERHDLSGTVVHADKPIWVVGATECAFVPWGVGYCNHLQEQMIPVEYWGKKYVGPHSPARGSENHIWRVYAGKDGVTVTVESNDAGYKVQPFTLLKRGDWKELTVPHGASLIFTATGPILPVQYLTGGTAALDPNDPNVKIGDPAMYQMIAVEQWLRRYVFVTGVDYGRNYAQMIRRKDAADVTIDGELVTGWYLINGTGPDNQWEVADVPLGASTEPVTHVAESADAFNVVVVGYTTGATTSAYAYPGGMNLKPLESL